ncbi:MAG: DUF3598 family protein [Prochlorococcaceae cyanobacterium]|jgi:hypothetical protein
MSPAPAVASATERRRRLLAFNAGRWQGSFVRLDERGQECDRFPHDLHVRELEEEGLIEACLTNCSSGTSRSMSFQEPPAEMHILSAGHWSLGPERIGDWSWVSELCLVHGDQRRRAVVRLRPDRLESLVLVWEARPGVEAPVPAAPLLLPPPSHHRDGAGRSCTRWTVEPGLWIETSWQEAGDLSQQVELHWEPQPGEALQLRRSYGPYGMPEPWDILPS